MYAEHWMAHGLQEVICGFQNNLTVPGSEFDDMVVWVPSNILLSLMVSAKKLP